MAWTWSRVLSPRVARRMRTRLTWRHRQTSRPRSATSSRSTTRRVPARPRLPRHARHQPGRQPIMLLHLETQRRVSRPRGRLTACSLMAVKTPIGTKHSALVMQSTCKGLAQPAVTKRPHGMIGPAIPTRTAPHSSTSAPTAPPRSAVWPTSTLTPLRRSTTSAAAPLQPSHRAPSARALFPMQPRHCPRTMPPRPARHLAVPPRMEQEATARARWLGVGREPWE